MDPNALLRLFSLAGRVALVTGASGDIGRALARGLAGAGAIVALSGRNVAALEDARQEIVAAGGRAQSFPADISRVDEARQLAQAVVQALGGVDILVNCAGTNRRMPILEMPPEVYDQIMATNLRSAYFLSQALVPAMAARGGGKIINIGSLTSLTALANVAVYGMTKSALAHLTKSMAIEWAAYNVQVNCLCPGFIHTRLTEPLWSDEHKRAWMLERVPLKRAGRPDDLVGLAIYLAAPASDFLTGQVIAVDGGFLAGGNW